ncbi:MAG TPA: hypothetical protein VFV19_17900 [Candidatus Polarisedimenticolaceae bacterium]|nr:hypothetical protein [Candidatus Polarisedimenticolaceae bacterium]
MNPQTSAIFTAVAIAVIVIAAVAYLVVRNRRTEELRRRFGTEYDRTLKNTGRRSAAEADLAARTRRVENLAIHPLAPGDRDRFAERWRATQASFVDNPVRAVTEASALVDEVMRARGYPVADFEMRASDISVDHPRFVENYREAHAIAVEAQRGTARTEDLRRATIHYRDLFENLLETAA